MDIKQIVPMQACILDGNAKCHFIAVRGVADNLTDTYSVNVMLFNQQQQLHAEGYLYMQGDDYVAQAKDKNHVWSFLKRELKGADGVPLQFIEQ